MDEKIIFERDSANVKNPCHLNKDVFSIYAPRNLKIEPTRFRRTDTGLWVKILNKSFEDHTEIKKVTL